MIQIENSLHLKTHSLPIPPKFVHCFSLFFSFPPTRSHLCWRQLLQVPVQPERGLFQGCVCPVPGDDWWENMTVGLLLPNQFFFFFPPFAFFWFGRRREDPPPPVALVILSDLVIEQQAKGGTKHNHKISKDEHVEVPTKMQIFFFFGLSQTPEDYLRTRGTRTWLPNQTLEQRGNVIFLNGQRVSLFNVFRGIYKGWLFLTTKMIRIVRRTADIEIFVN